MLRKGFTLIELLIVITIIAILAGAALPFVQDYLEDARLAKVKADLDEIKNALMRYELDTGKIWPTGETTLTKLVGPYLAKPLVDPWGVPYVIDPLSSLVYSKGPDRLANPTGSNADPENFDNIYADFRPPLALSRVYWIDANKDGVVNAADQLKIRFTREANATTVLANTLTVTGDALSSITFGNADVASGNDGRDYIITLTGATFVPGRDMIIPASTITDTAILPTGSPNATKQNLVLINSL